MKPKEVFLDELNSNIGSYKVQVKVIEKGRPKTSPKKGIIYQNLIIQDCKGNKMKGALFGDQVEAYKDAFVYNGEYEISNAPIKVCDERWKNSPNELDFQMNFGRQTIIQPINPRERSLGPSYQCIANIPRAGDPDEKFDVLGVVLYVEENPRQVPIKAQQQEVIVREIVIIDHSSNQPMVISAWNDLAETECNKLMFWREKLVVVGFTALKAAPHRGERGKALHTWSSTHQEILRARQTRILEVRDSSKEICTISIHDLKQKTVDNTLQEERHRLLVSIRDADLSKVVAYLGCSRCGRQSGEPVGASYTCKRCNKVDCISVPRISFTCEVYDNTGALQVTTFDDNSERLFRMSSADLFRIKHTGDESAFEPIKQMLLTTEFLTEVGPKTTLSVNNALQWGLKKVVLQDANIEEAPAENIDSSKAVDIQRSSVQAPHPPTTSVQSALQEQCEEAKAITAKKQGASLTIDRQNVAKTPVATGADTNPTSRDPSLSPSKIPHFVTAPITESAPAKKQKLKNPKIEKNPAA